jgi:hypothetical protein
VNATPSQGAPAEATPSATDQAPGAPQKRGAQDQSAPQKQQRTTQQPSSTQKPNAGTAQSPQGASPNAAPGATQNNAPGATQKSTQAPGDRPMTSRSVSLTTEQKTTIRRTVLTSSAPRVTNVTFEIRVGTVVPRTVRVAPLPREIIEIEPEWRGYMYFVSGDEIIVVEPGTLRIVAVIDV